MNTRTRHVLGAALAAGAVLASAACSGGGDHKSTPTPTPPTSSATSSTPAPPPPAPAVNPFTGIGPVPRTPTIAVKIDDTAPGRPQVGIDRADIVYIEAAEGGLTRLAAVFGTYKPTKVGYVRSTRPSDPDLLLQFGKITEAYSGGAHDSLPLVRRSGIKSWSMDAGAPFYHRVSRYQSSYINVVLNVSRVAHRVKTPLPKSIGWTFDRSLSGLPTGNGMRFRTEVTGSYAHGTPVEFRYWKALHKYVRFINGVPQHADDRKPIAATNVIVQRCRVVAHPQDTDVNGNPSQFTFTVGSGKVTVFRGGKRIVGTWSRKRTSDGTTLRLPNGKPIPLAPGNTWVVLIRAGIPVTG